MIWPKSRKKHALSMQFLTMGALVLWCSKRGTRSLELSIRHLLLILMNHRGWPRCVFIMRFWKRIQSRDEPLVCGHMILMRARFVSETDVIFWLGKKTKKKSGKTKSRPEVKNGPWLKKLHLYDNSIDDHMPNQLKPLMELICTWVLHRLDHNSW